MVCASTLSISLKRLDLDWMWCLIMIGLISRNDRSVVIEEIFRLIFMAYNSRKTLKIHGVHGV